ncbi:site-2 protease family protein [Antarcticimicrobium sediminis]|uniref:Zinc metalloprotease n=1 Tax=Antarcticimicrobium sediminis TaxID=2546227 RepID=A0A4R5EUF3_9RHOB|nr:site-2 protease family protein [Antarcticimicrobium sediminis]TDE38422.1 CBS domain-containing protein [Antarcticimicrobium sediminis]
MSWSFSIGRLFGSDLRIHVTFFLLLAWVGYAAYADAGWSGAVQNVLFVIALFACVVAHEFGHALTARRYGIKTPDITLLPIGGMARLERMPENPRQEILVALAGPLVNVVIWAVLMLAGARLPLDSAAALDLTGPGFLGRLAFVNLFLALFNLIPAFPMDGGRVFRALLSMTMDRVRATRVAATAGQIVAFLFGFAGMSTGNPMLILIAVFVFVAANAESQDVAMRAVARQLSARDATITSYESLTPADTLQAAASALVHSTQHEFPVIDTDGTFLGFVTRNALFAALAQEGPRTRPVAEIMQTDIPSLPLTTRLEKVLDALYKGAPAVTVTDSKGHMIGYVTRENVGELMVINGR